MLREDRREKLIRLPALGLVLALMATGCLGLGESEEEPAEAEDARDNEDTEAEDSEEDEDTEEGGSGGEGNTSENGNPSAPAGSVVVTESFHDTWTLSDVEVQMTAMPLVREEYDGMEFLSAAIEFELIGYEGEEPEEDEWRVFGFDAGNALVNPAFGGGPMEVRLVDTENMWVQEVESASDGEYWQYLGELHHRGDWPVLDDVGDSLRWTASYQVPDIEDHQQLSVLLPYFGLVEEIPVIDADEAEWDYYQGIEEASDGLQLFEHSPHDLEIYREHIEEGYGSRYDGEETTLTVSSDLLFDPDEYELSSEAEQALEGASDEIDGLAGGELKIIGHTDDVGSEEHNQELSENRAESVHEYLEDLIDLSNFDEVTVEGRNFAEPVGSNDSDEGRAQNRRVELVFTPPEVPDEEDIDDSADVDPPETDGPVATTGEIVEVEHEDGRTAELSIEELYQVDGVLVGRINIVPTNLTSPDAPIGAWGDEDSLSWPVSFGGDPTREGHDEFNTGLAADAPTLIVGESRIFPLDYGSNVTYADEFDDEGNPAQDEELPARVPLSDRRVGHPGQSVFDGTHVTVTVIWPAVDAETVIIDVPDQTSNVSGRSGDAWRFEDIPVNASPGVSLFDDDPAASEDEDGESEGDNDQDAESEDEDESPEDGAEGEESDEDDED